MEKTAKEVIASGEIRAVVDYSIETNRRIASLGKELDEAKRHLREMAKAEFQRSGEKVTDFVGNLGTASVVVEKDLVKSKKEVNLADIEENLSDETFAKLFVTRVVVEPASDLLDKLGDLTAAEKAVVENFLDIQPSTPKVYLPK